MGEGIVAFVLKYSVAPLHFPMQWREGRQAVRWIRQHAPGLAIDSAHVGVMGFSAGAHLAGLIHTAQEGADRQGGSSEAALDLHTSGVDVFEDSQCLPSVAVLCYPVVTLDPNNGCAHNGSRKNLLGKDAAGDERLCC